MTRVLLVETGTPDEGHQMAEALRKIFKGDLILGFASPESAAMEPLEDWDVVIVDAPDPNRNPTDLIKEVSHLRPVSDWDCEVPALLLAPPRATNGSTRRLPWHISTRQPGEVAKWIQTLTHPQYTSRLKQKEA